jgi:hypothetical protein
VDALRPVAALLPTEHEGAAVVGALLDDRVVSLAHLAPAGARPLPLTTHTSIAWDLTRSASSLLALALHERRGGVFKTSTNHATHHRVGAIVLVLTAFDAWLNETLSLSTWHGGEDLKKDVPRDPAYAKYERLAQASSIALPNEATRDLKLLGNVRNELVHHLPRPASGEGNVPSSLLELHRRDLFVATGRSGDFHFSQKLGSYKLAYWSFQTVETAVSSWVDHATAEWEWQFGVARNFSRYLNESCPPEDLAAFDALHGIELTRWET